MLKVKSGALQVLKTIKGRGGRAYLVGGCVRDSLLGIEPQEWDITTSARPDKIIEWFEKVAPTGLNYGTVTVLLPDGQYEVTTFRSDENYFDGRHPGSVKFTDDIHKDLSRRDFTVNALAYDPETDELIDDFNGREDLKNKIIRAVGSPIERFSEDGLRPIRACRFAAKLEFAVEPATFAAIAKTLATVKKVAPERIHDELVKMLAAERPSIGFELLRKAGLLKIILPELEEGLDVEQPPQYHQFDVYRHNLYACDAAPKDNPTVRLAVLLHDIGKPACKAGYTFYNHDKAGAETVEKILKRLKFSRDETDKIVNLVSHHMFEYTSEWSDAAVRRFIRRVGGVQNIPDLFALRRADVAAMIETNDGSYLVELQKRIDKVIEEENALDVKDLKVGGLDVMETLKIQPGPKVGQVLNALLEKVLDDPKLNERETLLKLIKNA